MKVLYIACTDYECREVDEVMEERFRQWRGCDRCERELETNEEIQSL